MNMQRDFYFLHQQLHSQLAESRQSSVRIQTISNMPLRFEAPRRNLAVSVVQFLSFLILVLCTCKLEQYLW
ncbi:MAG: hypothetical protein H7Y37_06890 [Anaerolineae bacterium]|nr:hypothetical protein [Gloeobacterales cyanobacterium ES-bin-313]